MLRLLFLGALFYGMVIGIRDEWLIIKWSKLFHNIGFTQVDPNKPMNWSEFIVNTLEKNSLTKED